MTENTNLKEKNQKLQKKILLNFPIILNDFTPNEISSILIEHLDKKSILKIIKKCLDTTPKKYLSFNKQ